MRASKQKCSHSPFPDPPLPIAVFWEIACVFQGLLQSAFVLWHKAHCRSLCMANSVFQVGTTYFFLCLFPFERLKSCF